MKIAYPVPLEIVGIGVTRENVVPVSALAAQPTLLTTPALLHGLDAFYSDKDVRYDSYDTFGSKTTFRVAPALLIPETNSACSSCNRRGTRTIQPRSRK